MDDRELSKAMCCVETEVYKAIFNEGYEAAKEESRPQLEALMAAKEAVRFIHNWDMDRLGMIAATKISTAWAALRAAGIDLEEKHD